jgi:hypothetical protein
MDNNLTKFHSKIMILHIREILFTGLIKMEKSTIINMIQLI